MFPEWKVESFDPVKISRMERFSFFPFSSPAMEQCSFVRSRVRDQTGEIWFLWPPSIDSELLIESKGNVRDFFVEEQKSVRKCNLSLSLFLTHIHTFTPRHRSEIVSRHAKSRPFRKYTEVYSLCLFLPPSTINNSYVMLPIGEKHISSSRSGSLDSALNKCFQSPSSTVFFS